MDAIGPGMCGLEPKFSLISEKLKQHGYATAHFGKWHIGDAPDTRPTASGFDEHAGLLVSNDMWRHNPWWRERVGQNPLPYWEKGAIKIPDTSPDDQKHLTGWATKNTTRFIRTKAGKQPFFLYLAHSMPHVPLYCRDKFKGKSGAGIYGDVMMEIDWSVGEIMTALRETGVEKDTIVLFTSDNGPWKEYGNHAGKTPFHELKGTSFEGGIRSALIVKYPGNSSPARSTTALSVPSISFPLSLRSADPLCPRIPAMEKISGPSCLANVTALVPASRASSSSQTPHE